jgi:hypothetical protein
MCGKGGGSPPVPSAASTTFNSTTAPSQFAGNLYTDFLNRANDVSKTAFNPAMLGTVAPLNAQQTQAGNTLFNQGLDMGNFDPAKVQSIESPFTEDVVNKTQDWFNNQNAIQSNDLLSGAIKAGNAFGGDRAGVAQGVMAGQQQLAQAPVIAGLRQAGYTQALNEYNQLKTMGLQGAGAALGWGTMQQQQAQKEADVAQQNAMMSSAYPFQSLNWYGSLLGGVGPLLGQTAAGSNNPPSQSGAAQAIGAAGAGIGLIGAATGAGGQKRGGIVRPRARGGLVPIILARHSNGGLVAIPMLADGGSADDDEYGDHEPAGLPEYQDRGDRGSEPAPAASSTRYNTPQHQRVNISSLFGRPNIKGQAPTFPIQQTAGTAAVPQKSTLQSGLELATKAIPVATSLFALSDPKTKTDVQRVGKTDGGEPLYGFRYKGDPKSYPKVVGPMALPPHAPQRRQEGGDVDDDQLTMTDLGVLDPRGRELSPGIAGPARGSPSGELPKQAEDMPNLARVRERFRPMLESNPALRQKFDANTTAEVGTNPAARNAYQALTLDRAAARGESLPYTLSRGPDTPDRYYPGTTTNARAASGIGVSPALWGGANPVNFATGNASFDPRTGRYVGFAGGPQTGSVQTGSGTEYAGVEGPDLPAARRFGYTGPSMTGIGPRGPQGADVAQQKYPEGEREKVGVTDGEQKQQGMAGPRVGAGPPGGSRQIPGMGAPPATFAQRLATNPFWQFGTALMAKPGIRGRELSAIGGAAQSMSAQQIAERNRVLDEKPQIITTADGMVAVRHSDGKIMDLGLKSPGQAQLEESKRQHGVTEGKPFKVGDDVLVPDGQGGYKRYTPPEDPNAPPQQPWPTQTAPAQPAAPAPAQPAPTAPSVKAPVAPSTGVGNAPAAPAPAQPAQPAQPAAPSTTQRQTQATTPDVETISGGPGAPVTTDDQKETAAQVAREGYRYKNPPAKEAELRKLLEKNNTSPEQFDFNAQRLAKGDTSILQNLGNSKEMGKLKQAYKNRAADYYTEQGKGPDEANAMVAKFGGMKSGARVLANRLASMETAIANVQGTAPIVLDISARIPRTQYPKLNDVILAYQKNTGGTEVRRLGVAVETLAASYANALTRTGVTTEGMREHARSLLEQGYTHGQMGAVVDQMLIDMSREQATTKGALDEFLGIKSREEYKPGDVLKNRPESAPPSARKTAPAAPTISGDERAKAEEWLRNNPNDPNAARVKKTLGIQ